MTSCDTTRGGLPALDDAHTPMESSPQKRESSDEQDCRSDSENGTAIVRTTFRGIEWLAPLVLVILILAMFSPALRFEFIALDTPDQILENAYVHELSARNLYHILTTRCVTSYYPVRTLSFAVDCHFWGLRAFGFKLTNLLIHAVNVLLVYWLIRRVQARAARQADDNRVHSWTVFAATWAAGLYGVHPLVVEPVVWVPGREELLMTLGTLGAVHCHVYARWQASVGGRAYLLVLWHIGAALFCLMACLSNAVGAVVPLLLMTWDFIWLCRPRMLRMITGTALPWAIAVATFVVKRVGYVRHPGFAEAASLDAAIESLGVEPGQSLVSVDVLSWQHVGLVLRAFWLNLSSIFWPDALTVSYDPIIPPTLWHPEVVLGGIALAGLVLAAWLVRKRKDLLSGVLWFGVALAPVSQVMPHHIHRADRFLYLPLVGLSIVAGAAVWRMGKAESRAKQKGLAAVCIMIGLASMVASTDQLMLWQNNFTVWRNAVQVAPRNYVAHRLLANELADRGEFCEAFEQYRQALAINAFDVETLDRYARYLAVVPPPDRDTSLAIRLATFACQISAFQDRDCVRTLAIAYNNRGEQLRQQGAFGEALRCYCQASEHDPDYVLPRLNRALLLASCEVASIRDVDEARREARLLQSRSGLTGVQAEMLAEILRLVGDAETSPEAPSEM